MPRMRPRPAADPRPLARRTLAHLARVVRADGRKLPEFPDDAEHVLNGIAFDPGSGHFFVTGKCWPVLFEIRVLEGDR